MAKGGAERQLEGMKRFLQLAEEGANWQLRVAVGWQGTRFQRIGDPDCSILLSRREAIQGDRKFLEQNGEQILAGEEQVIGLPSGLAVDLIPESRSLAQRLFFRESKQESLTGLAPWMFLTPRGQI
ncbi:hypothetical protein A3C59_01650 [Candidatus Daviesbacteria bacterium RIFCSPHIGHO2_02_FULL_36_13]|uniref:Uncharacterized protein n=1 Tax=Candidatus Daviesbacteria bacterium RIFCSPHIGHO2_02_FULL_36_13 TaxID=1797768 RepID=A0A1F5JT20_9BACT|nr:MAG: hypothetical protein A3C59_01650 [Candidatus Daviesbacteria bacterium RIFCSPHIGHO2_02_FULL_36_13]